MRHDVDRIDRSVEIDVHSAREHDLRDTPSRIALSDASTACFQLRRSTMVRRPGTELGVGARVSMNVVSSARSASAR